MDGISQAVFLEMHWVIKCALNTKSLGLKLEPKGSEKEPWEIIYFGDWDYPGDLVTKRSVGGFVLYVIGVPAIKSTEKQNAV